MKGKKALAVLISSIILLLFIEGVALAQGTETATRETALKAERDLLEIGQQTFEGLGNKGTLLSTTEEDIKSINHLVNSLNACADLNEQLNYESFLKLAPNAREMIIDKCIDEILNEIDAFAGTLVETPALRAAIEGTYCGGKS
jgi:hypothetical protein